jgi:hypothetical protein
MENDKKRQREVVRENRKRRPTGLPKLNKAQKKKFLRFVVENRTAGDFEVHLGLNRRHVEILKDRLAIHTEGDAKKLLKDLETPPSPRS